MKVNIAYLVEAHTDIEQLVRLCDALLLSGDVFVHVDKKTRDKNFWKILNRYQFNHDRVTVLHHRHYVAWAGYSQVECFQSLLQEALVSNVRYERFLLLSGLDFPIWSPQRIRDFFEKNLTREFVCGYDISNSGDWSQLHKIVDYHFFRDIPLPHKSFLRRVVIGGARLILKKLGFSRKPYLKMGREMWNVYFGSSWIGVTRPCAEYLDEKLKDKDIRAYFKTVYAPDELCVPTIVMNSKFRRNAIKVDNLSFQGVTPLHYLNYVGSIWSYDENDFDDIVGSGKMFVRKVISGKSEKLIDLIKNTWGV